MVLGMLVVPLVSLITPKLKKEHVEDCFQCYRAAIKEKETEEIVQRSVIK